MKITPVAAPAQGSNAPQSITMHTTNNTPARARAIAMLSPETAAAPKPHTQIHTQEYPVQNANQVSVEELSAIKAPSEQPETQPEAPKEEPVKNTELERQYQELARQERVLRARAQKQAAEFKAKEEALQAQYRQAEERIKAYEQGYISKDKFKADGLAALEEAGSSYDAISQQVLTQQPKDPRVEAHISRLEAKISELEKSNRSNQESNTRQQEEQYKAAVRQIETEAKALVKSDAQAYEAIAATNSIKDVVDLIEQTYHKDGVLLSVEEAAQEVENYLVEEGLSTLSRIEKIKKRLVQTSAVVAPAKQEEKTAEPQKTQMKTLTNTVSSTRKLSAKERAIARANGFKGDF